MDETTKLVQDVIRDLRSKGMSQKRIASAIGSTQASVSRWSVGLIIPSGAAMLKLMALHGEKCGE